MAQRLVVPPPEMAMVPICICKLYVYNVGFFAAWFLVYWGGSRGR